MHATHDSTIACSTRSGRRQPIVKSTPSCSAKSSTIFTGFLHRSEMMGTHGSVARQNSCFRCCVSSKAGLLGACKPRRRLVTSKQRNPRKVYVCGRLVSSKHRCWEGCSIWVDSGVHDFPTSGETNVVDLVHALWLCSEWIYSEWRWFVLIVKNVFVDFVESQSSASHLVINFLSLKYKYQYSHNLTFISY